MPEWTGQRRRDFLSEVMVVMHARYRYDPGRRGYTSGDPFPPPEGTRVNCEGAAYLMKDLAVHRSAEGALLPMHLQIVQVQDENRILFLWRADMMHALGGEVPPYVRNIGWIFDNHYRLRDLADGNRLYDPIFGTVSPYNYDGIRGSRASQARPDLFELEEIFGERYRVVTRGTTRELVEINHNAVSPEFSVTDLNFA